VYAAPFSFEHRRQEAMRARVARDAPAQADARDHWLLAEHGARLRHFEARGWLGETAPARPFFCTPGVGMERSHAEILTVCTKLGLDAGHSVLRGSTAYLAAADAPQHSDAAEHLIAAARATPADAEPLYVVALGCVTNIASALLLAPEIAERIVVVWTSGYPTHAPQVNHSFNLEQDLHATNVLLDSGVPLVYLPGYQVGAQLRLTLPEVEAEVRGRGAIGAYLHQLFVDNPLRELQGITDLRAHSWVMWDLINIAWLLEPAWVPTSLQRTPALDAQKRWQRDDTRPWLREAHGVQRDAIFADFFRRLEAAP
jgi:purine nucleosidase